MSSCRNDQKDLDFVGLGRVQRHLSVSSATDSMVDAQRPLQDVAVNIFTRHVVLTIVGVEVGERDVYGLSVFERDYPGRSRRTTSGLLDHVTGYKPFVVR